MFNFETTELPSAPQQGKTDIKPVDDANILELTADLFELDGGKVKATKEA